MIGKREIKLAVTGAVLFLIVGAVQGCASDEVTGPTAVRAQYAEGDTIKPICQMINGTLVCM